MRGGGERKRRRERADDQRRREEGSRECVRPRTTVGELLHPGIQREHPATVVGMVCPPSSSSPPILSAGAACVFARRLVKLMDEMKNVQLENVLLCVELESIIIVILLC